MKLNFDAEILDLAGKPLPNGPDGPMTLATIACSALIGVMQDDQSLPADDKVKMFRLAQQAIKAGVQEVKVEDVTLLKRRIGKMYGPLVVGRAYDLIEHGDGIPV
jgi:hypothetical protein